MNKTYNKFIDFIKLSIMGESILEKAEGRVSYHDSVEEMLKRIREDGMSNVFDRWIEQEKIRCKFCLQGLSCQLCSQGPCRINEKGPQKKGVCGIGPDAMAMRNFLLKNIMGAGTYSHHAYEAFRTLKATAEGKTPFTIKDVNKLKWMCENLGIDTNKDTNQMAIELADLLEEQQKIDVEDKNLMVEAFAPKKRKELWRKLNIYPAGTVHEEQNCVASCLTNVDGNYKSLAAKALRLGIATIYNSQIGLEMVQDILFGTPMPHEVNVDLGIMDPEYVNIVFNGHQPWGGVATIQKAKMAEVQQKAKEAGAKGLRVVGSIETGQELLQRFEVDDVFVGLMGNWLAIEPLLATGTVDVMAMEENCSPPAIDHYAEKYGATLVSISTIIDIPGLQHKIPYNPEKVDVMADSLIDLAIENFKKRKDKVKPMVPKITQKAIAGFSTEAVLEALGNKLDPLVDVIAAGKIKGVVALANCSTLRNGPQDWNTVNLTKELINKDILVVSGGCGNHALEVAGLCTLEAANTIAGEGLKEVCNLLKIPPVLSFGTCTDTGRISMLVTALADHMNLDVSDLPIAVTAPEWMEQKATIDGIFAVAYGAYTHLSPVPFMTGAPELVKLLTEEVENITGGKVALGDDPVEVANNIEAHIVGKRNKLGLS
ncbi:anaerobic carbon-monoxide dehydrogenase catalytic subunit [Clostridium botulinum]|uniref:Carbon monoxide dehydrogenase n=1 Tax=Clostridium botulinum (strain Okra / Type B1) TaxID=498213 RepID=B1IGW9_CLOBK|nr:anaerobic carbon-monoxide dehydrogenase catalytic subunit [Clostridium botulinum]ACA45163.1 carbon monoxide dehydrogenase [Clostridium botulinum B1 str. Okra]MBD5564281.1 anaerobic carbon-monoxide dehydrogenase catalytic subunit [Clostridium botulinum]MBD5566666.1 anaerobic carbon-monoxide dehydrogenase catalytic subunit [Clostridium botulinum]MBD5568818.1 anaerobic carbon-monoxide dehydrogenase catalytic subunit [Clostridium botulinum]MBD5572915.1 anaerobic carbon-monoxide dehydrogenase ca